MGNQPCAQCTANVQQNKAYGDFQLIQSQGYMVAVVQKKVERDQKLKCQILAKLQQRKNIKNSHIVRMIKYQIKQQGYGYQVLMHYQYIVKTLQDRVNDLQFRGLFFTQKQLFAIIYGVQNALKVLEENKIKHSCINMETIVCKNNFYKITDVSSTTYVTSYNLAVKGDRKQFLSQKLLQSLAHKSLQPPYDIKDDFFSLGMIILSIVSGKDAGDFYEWRPNNNASLKLNTIDLAFKEIERNFSSKLVKKVRSLVFQGLQMDQSQVTNLTDSLQELDQEFGRVLKKIKRLEIDRKY